MENVKQLHFGRDHDFRAFQKGSLIGISFDRGPSKAVVNNVFDETTS